MLNKLSKIFNNRARRHLLEQNEANADVREASSVGINAKVIYADGSIGPDRLVSYGHRNFFIHAIAAPLAYLNGWFWERWYTSRRNRRVPS